MTPARLLGGLVVVLSAALYFVAVRSARRHLWGTRILAVLGIVSGIALVAMVLTDWPGEQLARFWADHSILATVVSSLLLLSVGYLAFEAGENANQAELNRSVTSAGLSGLVDHLIDVDIALAMISNDHVPAEFEAEGKPLRWMRPIRERLQDGVVPVELAENTDGRQLSDWRQDVIDQCIRRVMAGMRDWAALITISSDGRQVLKRFGELRLDLLQLRDGLSRHGSDGSGVALRELRKRLQRFAIGLEHVSSPEHPRPGLTNFVTGGLSSPEVEVTVDRLKTLSPPTPGALMPLLDTLDGRARLRASRPAKS